MDYDRLAQEVVTNRKFECSDFLHQQKTPLAEECDVAEIVRIYACELRGQHTRKKYHARKVSNVESLLTPSGMQKLRICRIDARMVVEKFTIEEEKQQDVPPISGEYKIPSDPWCMIKTLQAWGDHGDDSPKYYLHMVFRYQMRLLHKSSVSREEVIDHPSLQYVVDILYPSTCSSKFPPEFKQFMQDSDGRRVNTVTLPVPKRSNAKEVDYTRNFEAERAVSDLRRKLQKTIPAWKCSNVYPRYLLKGDQGNDAIIDAVAQASKLNERKKKAERADEQTLKTIATVAAAVPAMAMLSTMHSAYKYKTSGERLKERLGFFLRPSVRRDFVALRDEGLIEAVFDLARTSYDQFRCFDLYCTADSPLAFLDGENGAHDSRVLVVLLEHVVSLFGVEQEVDSKAVEPQQVVLDTIKRLVSSCPL